MVHKGANIQYWLALHFSPDFCVCYQQRMQLFRTIVVHTLYTWYRRFMLLLIWHGHPALANFVKLWSYARGELRFDLYIHFSNQSEASVWSARYDRHNILVANIQTRWSLRCPCGHKPGIRKVIPKSWDDTWPKRKLWSSITDYTVFGIRRDPYMT